MKCKELVKKTVRQQDGSEPHQKVFAEEKTETRPAC